MVGCEERGKNEQSRQVRRSVSKWKRANTEHLRCECRSRLPPSQTLRESCFRFLIRYSLSHCSSQLDVALLARRRTPGTPNGEIAKHITQPRNKRDACRSEKETGSRDEGVCGEYSLPCAALSLGSESTPNFRSESRELRRRTSREEWYM